MLWELRHDLQTAAIVDSRSACQYLVAILALNSISIELSHQIVPR